MKATLISDITPFWCLMDDENEKLLCHLSDDSPGPVELDWDALTKSQRAHVHTGVLLRIISCDEPLPSLGQAIEDSVPEEKVIYGKEERAEEEAELRKEMVVILKGGIRQAKAHIVDFEDTKRLAVLIDLERRGKSRKGLLTFLVDKLRGIKIEEERAITESVMSNPAVSRGMYTSGDLMMEDAEVVMVEME